MRGLSRSTQPTWQELTRTTVQGRDGGTVEPCSGCRQWLLSGFVRGVGCGQGTRQGFGMGRRILKDVSGRQANSACEPWGTGEKGEEAEALFWQYGIRGFEVWAEGRYGSDDGSVGFASVCRDGLWRSGEAGRVLQPLAGSRVLYRCFPGIQQSLVCVIAVAYLCGLNWPRRVQTD